MPAIADQSDNSIVYQNLIRKMYEEQQKLELEYSRLRQHQLTDYHGKVQQKTELQLSAAEEKETPTVEQYSLQLDGEKAMNKSLKEEVVHLLEQSRRMEKRFTDLVAMGIVSNDTEKSAVNNSMEEDKRQKQLLRLSKLEMENAELKENSEFAATENAILADTVKDLEERLHEEKAKVVQLNCKLTEQKVLIDKYARNREVWKSNEMKATEEIKQLDNLISFILDTLKKLPDNVQNCPQLQQLMGVIDQSDTESKLETAPK